MLVDIRCVINWPGTMSFIKDLATTTAAGFAAYIAWRGLTTWQRQTIGQQYHDLARKLLVSAYRYRDAIRGIRNPAMWSGEMPTPPPDTASAMNDDQKRFYGEMGAYLARYKLADDAWIEAQPELLEAEALWGTRVKELFQSLERLDNEVRSAVAASLGASNPNSTEYQRQAFTQVRNGQRDVQYEHNGAGAFERDLQAAIRALEDELKGRLLRFAPAASDNVTTAATKSR